jgi:hypothetical protein
MIGLFQNISKVSLIICMHVSHGIATICRDGMNLAVYVPLSPHEATSKFGLIS